MRQIWIQSVYYDILINQTSDKKNYSDVSDEWRIFLFGAKYNLGWSNLWLKVTEPQMIKRTAKTRIF